MSPIVKYSKPGGTYGNIGEWEFVPTYFLGREGTNFITINNLDLFSLDLKMFHRAYYIKISRTQWGEVVF